MGHHTISYCCQSVLRVLRVRSVDPSRKVIFMEQPARVVIADEDKLCPP